MRGFSFTSPRSMHAASIASTPTARSAEAYLRIRAARLGREFPRVLLMLEAGELHLSAIKHLAPVLTQDNGNELLETARFKSKREARAHGRAAVSTAGAGFHGAETLRGAAGTCPLQAAAHRGSGPPRQDAASARAHAPRTARW